MTPRTKLLWSLSLLTVLGLVVAAQGSLRAATFARCGLALAAAAALAWWVHRAHAARGGFRSTPRLTVVQRVGLSPRSGLALVEVDGRSFLVTHGDGFARIRPLPQRLRVSLPLTNPTRPGQELAQ